MSTSKDVDTMTDQQVCDEVDSLHPGWYFNWCERDGSWEEIRAYLKEILE